MPNLATTAQRSLYDLPYGEVERLLAPLPPVHARALWQALYRSPDEHWPGHADFLPPLQRWIAQHLDDYCHAELPEVALETASCDGLAQKYLLRLQDGETIETVLMGYTGRHTACVSSQAGCAMGCVFCATGQGGFTRHLQPWEIVTQVLHVQRVLQARGDGGLRNLVLMGMGEPLHNYDAVMTALDIITDGRGLAVGPRHVTISTVGVVPGILRLAKERRPYHLAVSLHGASEEERGALVPVSRRWPLAELIAACRTYCESTGRRIFFEWTLIAGKNDSEESARRLGALLQGLAAHVNLIPLNGTPGFDGTAALQPAAARFQRVLREAGLPSTIRQRRGIDVAAGCGQLRAAVA